jgi:hypothetical protein
MLDVKNGMTNTKFPIIACRNLREAFEDILTSSGTLPAMKMMRTTYA